jgi:enoyl-CoA hydratase
MTQPAVTVERDGSVTVVTLDRPDVRNAVDRPTAEALAEAFTAFERDPDAAVAVFHGANGTFCAGADLKALAATAEADPDGGPATGAASGDAARSNRLKDPTVAPDFDPLDPNGPMGPSRFLLSKPVIAAVAGHAVAGGLELALWCDMRVVEEDAVFGVFCRRWGVPLIDGGTVRLPRLIGQSRALDMILTGRAVDAEEARAFGLANRVVPKGKARDAAIALAREIAAFPQTCLRNDRMSVYRQWDLRHDTAMALEFALGRETLRSGEAVVGAGRFRGGAGRGGKFGD